MADDLNNIAAELLSVGLDDAVALLYRGQTTTFAQLRGSVHGLCNALLGNGMSKGDRVGIFADNSPFFAICYLAVIRAGLTAVPFPIGTEQSSFEQIIQTTGAKLVLAQGKHAARVCDWAQQLSVPVWPDEGLAVGGQTQPSVSQRANQARPAEPFPVAPRSDLAAIMFTSGSTGAPKGVMVSHRNIQCNTRDIVSYLGLTAADRVMAVLPLSYCFGLSLLHTHLAAGGSVVLCGSFMFPEKAMDELESTQCTVLAGVPSTYQILLRQTRFAKRSFPNLRILQQAGGKLFEPFVRELRIARPGARLFIMYGQTEATARLSFLPPEMLDSKSGSIGRGLDSCRLEVLAKDGQPVKPGRVGEIVARGDNVALGYWNDPAETARYFRDGKLYTGDLATVDEDGYVRIVDRARDFIKVMGNRVSPKEIEERISRCPEVVEVAVVGSPDDLWGEALCAFVVPILPGAITAEQVRDYCNRHLPNFKVPQFISVVSALPKNAFGKVLGQRLRQWAAQRNPPVAT